MLEAQLLEAIAIAFRDNHTHNSISNTDRPNQSINLIMIIS